MIEQFRFFRHSESEAILIFEESPSIREQEVNSHKHFRIDNARYIRCRYSVIRRVAPQIQANGFRIIWVAPNTLDIRVWENSLLVNLRIICLLINYVLNIG